MIWFALLDLTMKVMSLIPLFFIKMMVHHNKNNNSRNLKSILMKLAQGEGQEINPKLAQQAEQALTNLTGQQLLSKSDGNGTLQSMFFNLPLMLGEKPENLQVFINSKNEGEQVRMGKLQSLLFTRNKETRRCWNSS